MPSLRRKHWQTLKMAETELEDATKMTTACLVDRKNSLNHNAHFQHQVEAPAECVPPGDDIRKDNSPGSTTSQSLEEHSSTQISASVSQRSDFPQGDVSRSTRSHRPPVSRQNAFSIPEPKDSKIKLASTSKFPLKRHSLTLYYYASAPDNVKWSPAKVEEGVRLPISKSVDFGNMNGVCKFNSTFENISPDSDNFYDAEGPIVPCNAQLVESPGPHPGLGDHDLTPKKVKSPDSQSVETFLSAHSQLSGDESDGKDEVGGAVTPKGAAASNGTDDIDGPIHLAPSANKSPNGSFSSSTLSPGSTGVPGVVLVPPSSSSSSQTVGSGTSNAARPTTLGAIPKVKMATLSPSYRPRDKREVSAEAMRVLDSMLKRSKSLNDASPLLHEYQAVMEMERIEESTDPDVGTKIEDQADEESLPDYDGCHSPVSKSNSVYSTSSQSSSFKHKIVPLTKKDVDDALQKNQQRKKHLLKRRRKSSTSSSTSTDEEVQMQRNERRKRKSFFKKAKDKLRKSLKHKRELSIGETKKSSDKSSSAQSPGAEVVGEVHTHCDRHVHTEVHPDPSNPEGSIVLRTETIHTSRDEKYPKKSGKHVETTVQVKESFPVKEKKDNRNLLDALIQYIRSGKAKIKRKSSKKHLVKSKSVEEIPLKDSESPLVDNTETTQSLQWGGRTTRRVTHEYHTQIGGDPELDEEEDTADGPQRRFRLDGLLKFRPAVSVDEERDEKKFIVSGASGDCEVPYEVHESRHTLPSVVTADGLDDVDFHSPSVADKPHLQRTNSEREHIYEKVADQLANIADNYDFTSPLSPVKNKQIAISPEEKEIQEPIVLAGSKESAVDKEVQKELGSYLRDKGDKMAETMPQLNPIVKDLVKNVSYTHFQTVLHQQMSGENNIQQIALFFNVIKQAVGAVGYGTAMAMQLKEMSLRYFEDRYADWVIGQGGWESIAEETDLSSEVD